MVACSWGKLWFDQQQAVALERMTEAVAIARRPIDERPALWRAWEADAERRKRNPVWAYTEMLPLLLAPGSRHREHSVLSLSN